jgi:K+-transporting ATPase ATPase A chain
MRYNVTLAAGMLIGRFLMIVPILALAGGFAARKQIPAGPGTFRTEGATFVVLLVGTVLLVGALTFLPALAIGPVVEHFALQANTQF